MDKQKIIAFFDRLADGWDAELQKDEGKINAILDAAGIAEGKAVLDIACGTGVMFPYYLGRNVAHITGADIAPKMLAVAASKFGGNEKIELICADAEQYHFEKQYDCCMIFNAFPHFGAPQALIENLMTALKAGGTLTVAHDWGRKALDRHHREEANEVSCGLMSETDLAQLFAACGLKEIYTCATEDIYIVSGVK